MRKFSLIVLALVFVFCLVGCGDDKSDDPNVGLWKAVSVSAFGMDMSVADVFEGDVTLELKPNGKFVFIAAGETGTGSWNIEDGNIDLRASDGNLSGTATGDTITLVNIEETGVDIVFKR